MAEEKQSFVSGLKDEATEGGVHFAASEVGKGVRSFLEGVVSPDVLRALSKGGFVKIAANAVSILIRTLLPDSKNGELIKDAVTEAFSEAFDFGESAKAKGGGSEHASVRTDFGAPRSIPMPRGFTYAVLGASMEVLGDLADFIAKVYAENGESEVENIFAWLCTLSQTELIGFSCLSTEQKIAVWKAQLDPKEQKHWADMAKDLAERGSKFLSKALAEFAKVPDDSLLETFRLEDELARLRRQPKKAEKTQKRWWQFWKIRIAPEYQIWKL